MNASLVSVPFHGHALFLVEQNNEPYTPMKPIVEGMGLDWKSQYQKLVSNNERTCMVMITIQVPGDTQSRETLCMPLRKLPGWLMTIHPSRVKPEIREKVIAYQNECDDVLWKYWNTGAVVNPRVQEHELKEVVRQALAEYAEARPAVDKELEKDRFRLEMMKFQADKAMKLKEMAFELQNRALMDRRFVRRVLEHSVSLLTGEIVAPKVSIDIASWLKSRGISPADGNAATFGKLVARVFRERYRKEPGKRPIFLNGREILANYYEEPDDLPIFEEALIRFRRFRYGKNLFPLFGGMEPPGR
ncbi:MAG: probable antirepressor protein (Ant) [Leptospirillum rubarum]|nr:MAG: probable antirepressor protein (Ant) [Leptospirillum rubarum]